MPSNKEAELGFLDESWLNKGGTRLNVSLLEGMTGAVEKRRDESEWMIDYWLEMANGGGEIGKNIENNILLLKIVQKTPWLTQF